MKNMNVSAKELKHYFFKVDISDKFAEEIIAAYEIDDVDKVLELLTPVIKDQDWTSDDITLNFVGFE